MSISNAKLYLHGMINNLENCIEEGSEVTYQDLINQCKKVLKELEGQNMDSNYDVIQGDCPKCPFADLFGGFCFYYRFYPANIGYGEATCRCEELKSRED